MAKYREGDKKYNRSIRRWEKLTPDGTWKPFGPSRRTRIAKAKARIVKGKADKANKRSSIAIATAREIPKTVKTPFKKIKNILKKKYKGEFHKKGTFGKVMKRKRKISAKKSSLKRKQRRAIRKMV